MKIDTLSIERFRSFKKLQIEGLGQVNLITGRNNTGKSSVLEALWILAAAGSPMVLTDILRYREEDIEETNGWDRTLKVTRVSMFASLFSGFPVLEKNITPIVIRTESGLGSLHVSLSVERFAEQRDSTSGMLRLVPPQDGLFPEIGSTTALVIESNKGRSIFHVEGYGRTRVYNGDWDQEFSMPVVFVSPYNAEHTTKLAALWDKVALTDLEKDVVDALRLISPEIAAVSMIGGDSPSRIAIARTQNIPRPAPLRSFGDGLNRLFGIILSLVNAKDGLLLIDEIENGLHHTVQLDVWRTIFRLARQLNIQVFATSHSWDCVESFQKAAALDHEAGVLIKMLQSGGEVKAKIFSEHELAIVTRDHIEVR